MQQKYTVISLLSGWGLDVFERSSYIYIYMYAKLYRVIGLVGRVFANGLGDLGSKDFKRL